MSDSEIQKKYSGLPRIGHKFHNHESDPNNENMNEIIDRYVILNEGKKWLRIIFKYPDETGETFTDFELSE